MIDYALVLLSFSYSQA